MKTRFRYYPETPIMKMRDGKIEKIYLRSGYKATPEKYDNYIDLIESNGSVQVVRLTNPESDANYSSGINDSEPDNDENHGSSGSCSIL